MALFGLARMTVSSSGTGNITLNSAVSGFLTFDLAGCSTAATGQIVSYAIADTTQSELGQGTYFSSGPTLQRGSSTSTDTLLSTNTNSPINMSNTAQVFITPRVKDMAPWASPTFTGTITAAAASFSGVVNVTNATASTGSGTGALVVTGGVGIGGALFTAGDVTISKATPNLNIQAASAGQQASINFYSSATNKWQLIKHTDDSFLLFDVAAASTALQVVNNGGAFIVNRVVDVTSSTASTSTSTGALIVTGGVGVGGALYAGGIIHATDATASTSTSTGSLVVTGGVGVGSSLYVGTKTRLFFDSTVANAVEIADTRVGSPGLATLISFINNSSSTVGSITFNGGFTGVVYNTTSDERLKPNRDRLPLNAGREVIDALEVYDYDREGNGIRGIGLLAQQAYEVHKSLATPGMKDGWWAAEKAAPMPFVIVNMQLNNARLDRIEQQLGIS